MKKIIEKIKKYSLKNNRSRILSNYYSKQMRKGKTFRANLIDKCFFFIIFFIMLAFFLSYRSKEILLSIYISFLFVLFFFKFFSVFSKKRQIKKIDEINKELKKSKILKEYDSLSSEEFRENIKDLFEEYLEINIEDAKNPIDFKFKMEGDLYLVKCLQSSLEHKISSRELGAFLRETREKEIGKAIFISNSYFIDKDRYKDRIILYDFDDIVEILKKVDRYPSDLDIKNYIVDRYLDKRNTIKKELKRLNTKKIINLYIISIVFYFMSYFVKYQLYYKLASVASFIFATLLAAYSFTDYIYVKGK